MLQPPRTTSARPTNRYDRRYDVPEAECACDAAAFQTLVDAVAQEIADALGRPVSVPFPDTRSGLSPARSSLSDLAPIL